MGYVPCHLCEGLCVCGGVLEAVSHRSLMTPAASLLSQAFVVELSIAVLWSFHTVMSCLDVSYRHQTHLRSLGFLLIFLKSFLCFMSFSFWHRLIMATYNICVSLSSVTCDKASTISSSHGALHGPCIQGTLLARSTPAQLQWPFQIPRTRGTSMLAPDPQPHPAEGLPGQSWGPGDPNLFGFMII